MIDAVTTLQSSADPAAQGVQKDLTAGVPGPQDKAAKAAIESSGSPANEKSSKSGG
jgi:hypothetical protein